MLKKLLAITYLVILLVGVSWCAGSNHRVLLPVRVHGEWGYINNKGKIAIKPRFNNAGKFHDGLAFISLKDAGESEKWGFIDETGRYVVVPQYEEAEDFSEDLAVVEIANRTNGSYGFIDRNGKMVIEPKFEWASSFSEGLAAVDVLGKNARDEYISLGYGYIDKTGQIVIPPKFQKAGDFHEGLAVVVDAVTHKSGYINKTGKMVIPARFDQALPFSEGLARISINYMKEEYQFIDKSGKVISTRSYHDASDFSEGLAFVNDRKSPGFIDKTGRLVVHLQLKSLYMGAGSFHGGLAGVCLSGPYWTEDDGMTGSGYGFIDKRGHVILKPKYAGVEDFEDGYARVLVDNDKFGYIDKTGKWIWKPTK